jgi:Signal transduction histidine kinase
MLMAVQLSWPAVLTFAATAATLYLVRAVWPYRSEPAGRLFVAAVAAMSVASLFNGLGFLVTAPVAAREALEVAFFLALLGVGALWLPFALVYTGRNRLVGPRAKTGYVVAVGVVALLLLTNPLHGLFWSEFEVVIALGAAGATYTPGPALFAVAYPMALAVTVGSAVVLVETLLSYGPLYRSQAGALAATSVVTSAAITVYFFGLGPVPSLNLVGLSLLPHALLDGYALFYGDMFVFRPSTRRIGENAAIDEVGNPVFVTDTDARVITLNDTAAERFDLDTEGVLGEPLDTAIDGDALAPPDVGDTAILRAGGARREYDVTPTPLEDTSGRTVGYTVTLNDVTDERQRQQRLEVFNRVLRHNLRNDLNVVNGALAMAETHVDDDGVVDLLQNAEDLSENLVSLGNRARLLDSLLDGDSRPPEVVDLEECLTGVVEELRAEWPNARVVVDDGTEGRVKVDRALLEAALTEAAGNGIEHNDGDEPTVRLAAHRDGDATTITVRDDGPGLPSHERTVVKRREETELSHGSGLGLWTMAWCVRRLGGTLEFDVGEGTTVRFELSAHPSEAV